MSYWPAIIFIILLTLPSLVIAQRETISDAPKPEVLESTGDHAIAIEDYERLIESISRESGEFSPDLFEPLMGLGRAYAGTGSVELAHETFNRAQHITHRNEGVYSPKQFEILEIKTRLAMQGGEPLEADGLQRFLFFLNTHNFEDLEVLPSYLDIGKWYMETGQYRRAQKVLKEAVTLIHESAGEYDLRLLEPLQLIAKSHRLRGACCTQKYLVKVLEIIENNDNVPQDTRATAYAELADAYTVSGKSKDAAKFYSLASQTMNSGVPQEPRMIAMSKQLDGIRRHNTQMFRPRRDLFAGSRPMRRMSLEEQLEAAYQPPQRFVLPLGENTYDVKIRDTMESVSTSEPSQKMVGKPFQFIFKQLKTILPGSLRNEANLANISITLDFTVTETGAIRDIEFAKSNAPAKLNRLMKGAIRKTRFRPALVDGRPVITHNVTLTQSFASNWGN
ncbi:MAG: hypothetical protein O6945_07150 [Gammaproteobacteria bacterium]|nr:hypothetical protein [Gammaproteobacteria bacterium]